MLYIFIDTNNIRILHLKKTLLGQYETSFTTKKLEITLLEKGKLNNLDVIASALKESFALVPTEAHKDHDVTLILPQESFIFFRADMPLDITPAVLESYLKEKARSQMNADIDNSNTSYVIRESEQQKKIVHYAIHTDIIDDLRQAFALLDLKICTIIPEPMTYFKLFEKTLRPNKKENIWYVSYDHNNLSSYIYDSFGLLDEKRWAHELKDDEDVQKVLHHQAQEYESKGHKLNRLILSGRQSEDIRQDTFTKNVGVWTNPLHRIIPHFYAHYVKMLVNEGKSVKELPVLEYDMLIGAFIFTNEHKDFSLMHGDGESKSNGFSKKRTFSLPALPLGKLSGLPWKTIGIFLLSFGVAFGALFGVMKAGVLSGSNFSLPSISLPSFAKATPTPEPPTATPKPPSPTPTPSITREEIRIKVLNGSGIAGRAAEVKSFLKEKGYVEILTGNADNFDFETTVVEVKDDPEIKQFIQQDIASQVAKPKFETLDDADASDIIITIGTDFK
ncbi:LytR C-terminal domain-containing protein [Candidatus Woesebacteria bacterium]|nr:LytR C-terminal domain-containing protein [Candidatus Woesebacteria bacterium]